jgi:hypothetical protein
MGFWVQRFWMPDLVRHDEFGLFSKPSKLHYQSFIFDRAGRFEGQRPG